MHFTGQVALVTGGARGVGAAIAGALAGEGADIVLWDAPDSTNVRTDYPLSNATDLKAVESEIATHGRRCLVAQVDVRRPDDVNLAFSEAVEQMGQINVVVCAAGIRSAVPVAKMKDEDWDDVINTNVHGTYHTIRAALPLLITSGSGRILVVAAEEGRRGAPLFAHYAAASWALIGLAKSVAWEVASAGIAVNVVCPGPIDTAMSDSESFMRAASAGRDGAGWDAALGERDSSLLALRDRHPTGHAFVELRSVVGAAMFLLAQPDANLTGSVVDVSAGLSAANSV